MPALAKHMAMPPPIVPAPITAARRTSRGVTPAGMSGTFCASRSAKKTWRRAFDSSLASNSWKVCSSCFDPSSTPCSSPWRIARTAGLRRLRPARPPQHRRRELLQLGRIETRHLVVPLARERQRRRMRARPGESPPRDRRRRAPHRRARPTRPPPPRSDRPRGSSAAPSPRRRGAAAIACRPHPGSARA